MAKSQSLNQKEETGQETVTISLDDLDALIERRLKSRESSELARAIQNLSESNRPANSRFISRPINPRDIDPDDYLDTPVSFFSLCVGRTVFDDQRYGRTVSTPFGAPIKFKMAYRFSKGSERSRDVQVVSVSVATIYSKTEAQWLREHSEYGVTFFENMEDATKLDNSYMEKLTEAMGLVNRMNDMRVIEYCKNYGIKVTDHNLLKYRKMLAHKIADTKLGESAVHKVNAVSPDFDPTRESDRDTVIEMAESPR